MDKELKLVNSELIEDCDCEEITQDEFEEIKTLGEAMIKKCIELGGVGLAAPQIGIFKKMFVWKNSENTFQIAINPKYFMKEKKRTNIIEACLSYPERTYYMSRYKKISASFYVLKDGELQRIYRTLSGRQAYIFQHETDHINGITIAMKGTDITPEEREDV